MELLVTHLYQILMTHPDLNGGLLSDFIIKQRNKCYSPLSNDLPEPKLLIDISSDDKINNTHLHQNHNIASSGYCVQYIALSERQNLDYAVQKPKAPDPASNDP
jgi:hypothetical protein